MRRRDFLATSGLMLASGLLAACGGPRPGPILQTRSGQIQGQLIDGIHQFLGIPYAQAPYGEYRFKPPQARAAWQGVFLADQFGSACEPGSALESSTVPVGEDCLNLNIWTPDLGASNLPVMVWVHGGEGDSGSGALPAYNGANFAAQGVILVTCNRRLGAEGFLHLQDSGVTDAGTNVAVLDQIEVLRWVQKHIRVFGGDPDNITLFGHGEGAALIQALVATPASDGLLHRVIAQSGSYCAHTPETAQAVTDAVFEQFALKTGDVDGLARISSAQLAALYPKLQAVASGRPYRPVISEAMPVHPADAAHAGFGLALDYLTGSCRDEIIERPAEKDTDWPAQRVKQVLTAGDVDRQVLLNTYQQQRPELNQSEGEMTMMGDIIYRVPTLRVAQGHALRGAGSTYCYYFIGPSQQQSTRYGQNIMVFGNPPLQDQSSGGAEAAAAVSAFMREAWCNFARSGSPSSDVFAWPQYDGKQQLTVAIDAEPRVLVAPFAQQRQILGRVMTDSWQTLGL
ncbi:MAG: carboxylesterase family protein [Pseudomonadota bacterium]|nr:carboxylesterase family protein [Pseudomonadota bacterium]